MQSKFSPIAKVRKQQMDLVENSLAKARNEKSLLNKKIDSLLKDIEDSKIPQSGSVSLISIFKAQLNILRREKDSLQNDLIIKEEHIEKLLAEYKSANLEFEKIKYLEEQDFEAHLFKINKQEQRDMDEISNMLFTNEKWR